MSPKTGEGELNAKMVSEAVALNKKFIGVPGMISKMKMLGDLTSNRMPDIKYQDSNTKRVMEINALFDRGADGGAAYEEFCKINNMESRNLTVTTAIGEDKTKGHS